MRKAVGVVALAVVVSGFTGAAYAQKSSSATGVYSCVDASGRRLTADRPIAGCADREQRLTMPGGAVRTVGPTFSETERADQAVQARREADERYRANDSKRRERALATRYGSKAAHDVERAEAIETLKTQIKIVQDRKTSLLEDRKKIDEEMEFYKKDPSKAPQSMQARLQRNRDELKEVDEQVVSLHEDIKRTNQRFDDEAQTLKQYWPK